MEFRSQRDIDIAAKIYGDWPLLGEVREDSWNVKFTREIDMTNDSHLFVTRDALKKMGAVEIPGQRWALLNTSQKNAGYLENAGYDEVRQMAKQGEIELYLPLWEGKKCWFYDYEFETTQFWISLTGGLSKLNEGSQGWDIDHWRTGFRRIAASTNERTLVLCLVPSQAFCSYGIIFPTYSSTGGMTTTLNEIERIYLAAIIGSFVLDFILRFSVTTSVAIFNGENLPVPRLMSDSDVIKNIAPKVLRLVCQTTTLPRYGTQSSRIISSSLLRGIRMAKSILVLTVPNTNRRSASAWPKKPQS